MSTITSYIFPRGAAFHITSVFFFAGHLSEGTIPRKVDNDNNDKNDNNKTNNTTNNKIIKIIIKLYS